MLIAMTGCGSTGGPSAGSASSRPVAQEPSSMAQSADPSTAQSADPSSAPPAEQTVSGVIIEGLRPQCRVLQTGLGRYALTGSPTVAMVVGDRVQVTGQARPDLINPCGRTFVVSSVISI
jgi:hypothetical protein